MASSSLRSIGKTNSLAYDLEKVKFHLTSLVLNAGDVVAKSKYDAEFEVIEKLIKDLEDIDKRIVKKKSEIFHEHQRSNSAVHFAKRMRSDADIDAHYEGIATKVKELTRSIMTDVENYELILKKMKTLIQTLETQKEIEDALDNIVRNLEQILSDLNGNSSDPDCDSSSTSNITSDSSIY